jgi:hypothetical protein
VWRRTTPRAFVDAWPPNCSDPINGVRTASAVATERGEGMSATIQRLVICCVAILGVVAVGSQRSAAQSCRLASDCDDADDCTQNRCIDRACVFSPRPINSACTDDGNDCTRDVCGPGASGLTCTHNPVPQGSVCSDDGDSCTRDQCQPTETGLKCTHNPVPQSSPCDDDGDDCTIDRCMFGPNGVQCAHDLLPGGSPGGGDDNSCTFDACLPNTNGVLTCTHNPLNFSSPCDDDGNDCTFDMCQNDVNGHFGCEHQPVGFGSSCDDHSPCTQGEFCDSQGSCTGFNLSSDCRTAAKASLIVKDNDPDSKDAVSFKWLNGDLLDSSELGDPTTTTEYTLCIFDGVGKLQLSAGVAPGGLCDGKPCWTTKPRGFGYKDGRAADHGIGTIKLSSGVATKSAVMVKGVGAALPDPVLPLTEPVTVRVVNDETGVCVGSVFTGNVKNTGQKYVAHVP